MKAPGVGGGLVELTPDEVGKLFEAEKARAAVKYGPLAAMALHGFKNQRFFRKSKAAKEQQLTSALGEPVAKYASALKFQKPPTPRPC